MLGLRKEKVINKVILIEIVQIKVNPAQPRKIFTDESINELAQSIKENGLLQPITVRKNYKSEFEIISGERRYRACKLLGYEHIQAICVEKTESESAILALIENIHRQDLNMFEQALALKTLINEWNVTQEEAAIKLQMAQSTLANKMRLLKLSKFVQEKLLEYNLSERHARSMLRIKDQETAIAVLEHVEKYGLNVAQTEKYIDNLLIEKPKKKSIPIIKDVRVFVNSINKAVNVMKMAGISATSTKKEGENFIEYIVRIPR